MEHYKIILSIGGNSIEISSHDKSWVEEKIKEYDFLIDKLKNNLSSGNISVDAKVVNREEITQFPGISINEFYKKYMSGKISSRPEIATFFVYYLTKSSDKKEFSASEIKDQFREVMYPGWNGINISDILNQAKKRAFLNNYNNQWALSMTGDDFVMNKMTVNG